MKMKTRHKITHWCIVSAFAMIVFLWVIFMFWWIFPYKTVDILNQPYVIENKEVKQGNNLTYVIDYCKYTDIVPIVSKQFIDGIVYAVPDSNVNLKKGCGKQIVMVKIPKNLPTGDYKLRVSISFQVNPIRVINSEYETEKFSVTK